MTITFSYNWPPGGNFVRLSFGMANVKDSSFVFRVGIVRKSDQTKVFWQGKTEWFSHKGIEQITFDVERGDKIVVDKKSKDDSKNELRNSWDTDKEWPAEAYGSSLIDVSHSF